MDGKNIMNSIYKEMNQCCNDQLAVEPRRIFQGHKNLTRILNPNCENEHLTAEQSVSMV